MRFYITWLWLFLHNVQARGDAFSSARRSNLCARLYTGPGKTDITTKSATCGGVKKMSLQCAHAHPGKPNTRYFYDCVGDQECIPTQIDDYLPADAGCMSLPQPKGAKGANDPDHYACSSGLNVGDYDLYVSMTITADSPKPLGSIKSCTVIQSGTQHHLFDLAPCDPSAQNYLLYAHTSYQACVEVRPEWARDSVGFTWHIGAPRTFKRGLEPRKPLSELFTISPEAEGTAPKVKIVLKDGLLPDSMAADADAELYSGVHPPLSFTRV